jgi:hypothetical protein
VSKLAQIFFGEEITVMETKLEREVRFLKIYALVATLVCAVFFLTAFTLQNKKQKFEEIDVERINIVEKDGKLRMVLNNSEKTPPIYAAGKVIPRGKSGGIYFYNDEGDECGGLVFGGKKEDGMGNAGAGFFFDQYQQDQTIGMVYNEYQGKRRAAFLVWDRPNIPTPEWMEKLEAARKMPKGAERDAAMKPLRGPLRVYVGKTRDDNASSILLFDADERERIRMKVAPNGQPKLEFLDESGKVIQSFPSVVAEQKK